MIKVKILRIAEGREWQPSPDNPDGGAGPGVKGAFLARRVKCQVISETGETEERDFMVPEPFSLEAFDKVIEEFKGGIKAPDPLEGAEARIDEATRDVKYFDRRGEELKLKATRELSK